MSAIVYFFLGSHLRLWKDVYCLCFVGKKRKYVGPAKINRFSSFNVMGNFFGSIGCHRYGQNYFLDHFTFKLNLGGYAYWLPLQWSDLRNQGPNYELCRYLVLIFSWLIPACIYFYDEKQKITVVPQDSYFKKSI